MNLISAPGLALQAFLKKAGVGLEFLIDIDNWCLNKELEVEYVMQFVDMQKQIINIWKSTIKTLNHHT